MPVLTAHHSKYPQIATTPVAPVLPGYSSAPQSPAPAAQPTRLPEVGPAQMLAAPKPGSRLTRADRTQILRQAQRNVRRSTPGLPPHEFRSRVDREIDRLSRGLLRQRAQTYMQAARCASNTGRGIVPCYGSIHALHDPTGQQHAQRRPVRR